MHARIPTTAVRERGRYAALLRSRKPNDPELLDAHRRMREEALIAAVERALKNAPTVTSDVQDRIAGLLVDHNEALVTVAYAVSEAAEQIGAPSDRWLVGDYQ